MTIQEAVAALNLGENPKSTNYIKRLNWFNPTKKVYLTSVKTMDPDVNCFNVNLVLYVFENGSSHIYIPVIEDILQDDWLMIKNEDNETNQVIMNILNNENHVKEMLGTGEDSVPVEKVSFSEYF